MLQVDNSPAKVHCTVVKVHPPGSDCLIVWGVYVPHEAEERRKVYDMLRVEVPKVWAEHKSAKHKCFSIMAGDWKTQRCCQETKQQRTKQTGHTKS